jgi:bifunctional UDP-N-acetylglucosamine pyrophosphorylase/glucosamine-1-phosphate N-acetyltransferase
LILCGDTPLFKLDTLAAMIKAHRGHGSDISVLSALFSDPTGYGRIVRDEAGRLRAIVEQKDGDDEILAIREINSGTYLVKTEALKELLPLIENNNAQGEYYLTDIVALGLQKGLSVEAFPLAEEEETLGVNSRFQLSQAEAVLLKRLRRRMMDSGVSLVMADTIYLEPGVNIENDVIIEPFTMICGSTSIGKGARIGAGAILQDAVIPAGMVVQPGMILTG